MMVVKAVARSSRPSGTVASRMPVSAAWAHPISPVSGEPRNATWKRPSAQRVSPDCRATEKQGDRLGSPPLVGPDLQHGVVLIGQIDDIFLRVFE
jgi:hypothetical protein